MCKIFAFVLLAALAIVANAEPTAEAKPGLAYSTPLVSSPFVAATSSQAIVRNYNGVAYSAPLVAAPAVSAPFAYSAPYVAASPYAFAPYSYSPYAAPLHYTAPSVVL